MFIKFIIKIFFYLIITSFINNSLYSQKLGNYSIKSRIDFNKSKLIYQKIIDNNFDYNEYFKNENQGISYFESALNWANQKGNVDDVIFAKVSVLGFYINNNDNIEKIARIRDLLKYNQVYKSYLIRDLLYDLKRTYRQTEQFNDFLKILPDYHKYCKLYGYKEIGEENYDCEIAFVNYRLKNYQKAIESYKKCSEALLDDGKLFPQSSTVNNIGLCFSKMRKLDSANYYYIKSIDIANKYKATTQTKSHKYVDHFINVIQSNIASLDTVKPNFNKKLYFFSKELKSAKTFNEKNIISSAYYNIAEVYYTQKKTDLTLMYLDSVSEVLKSYSSVEIKKKSIKLRAKTMLLKGKFKKANMLFSRYDKFIDSLDTEKAKKDYLIGIIKHETDVRTKELEESKIVNQKERKTIFGLVIGLALLGICLFGFLMFHLKSREKNKIIKAQKEDLNDALKEKEVLLKEIHHRVKNNLQVVSGLLLIQSKKKTNVNFNEILLQSQRQIESMSLVHEMLYQKENLAKINTEEYFKKLTESSLSAYPQIKVTTNIKASEKEMDIDIANPIGLIINELITNSLKHGFKESGQGKISITFNKKNAHLEFKYKDNGCGIDFEKYSNSSSKFGNRLISSLADEINATIEMKNNNGLTYIFKFQNKKK